MAIDHRRIATFLAHRSSREAVARVVRGAGFRITWIVEDLDERLWGLFLKPNDTLQELFGTTREVLLWAAEFHDFQARTIQQATRIIEREQPRLSDEYCLICVVNDDAVGRVAEVAANLNPEFVGVALSRMEEFRPAGARDFTAYLQSRLFSRDLYRISTPLTDPRGFYGRKALLNEINTLLGRGISHVGVFGLRKMGKTSLLYRLLEMLRSSGRSFVCHVDVQRLDSVKPSVGYALWSIGEALIDSNVRLRKLPGLRLFGKYSLYSEVKPETVPELFDHDVRYIISSTSRTVVFLLDEIELMSPIVPGARWGDAFVVLWRLLRGLHQQFPGRLAFLVTGTNPKCIEMNLLNDLENPAYNYFDVKYLPALDETEAHELLSTIGLRMGLEWAGAATRLAFRLTGGHPFLLRGLASVVQRNLSPRQGRVQVSSENLFDALPRFLIEFNPNLSQMVDVLRDYYEDEFFLLETLAVGRIGDFREMAEAFPEDVAHLHGYGLLDSNLSAPRMSVEVLQTWLQRRQRTAERVRQEIGDRQLAPGDRIERYEVVAAIGHRGGFAQVYRCRPPSISDGADVAIKVFRSGLLPVLQREMDALNAVSHPNIVKFIEHGRTKEGWLYLVMEYLAGASLRSRIDRASRLGEQQAMEVLRKLGDALCAMHPDEVTIAEYRKKEELTPGELEELEKARHGFVHRDIKPENIMLVDGRGPVLIDFNISSTVGSPVQTLKHTPGYIPPEGFPAQWSSTVDMYALGITILQVATGLEFDGKNLEDLRMTAQRELAWSNFDLISRLCASDPGSRISSARNLCGELEELSRGA